ncbi:MAG: hypothetical protein QXS20_03720 [Candidatus Thorarchaeota archaeon]
MVDKNENSTRRASILQRNAQVLHVLYGLLESDKEPTDADAEKLRYLYSSS